jgi:hypothetical protein
MSYEQKLRGEIRIDPPATWDEYKSTTLHRGEGSYPYPIRLRMERAVPMPGAPKPPAHGGPEYVAVALYPADEAYGVVETLETAVPAFVEALSDTHMFTGYLVRHGEEQGDVERYSVCDGKLVSEEARLVWADGTDVAHDDYCL